MVIGISLTPDEAKDLRALASSARAYPGRVRRYSLTGSPVLKTAGNSFQVIELMADPDLEHDMLYSHEGTSLRFHLACRGHNRLDEVLDEIDAGAWDLSLGFPCEGQFSYEREVSLLIL
jgi:hypothetical protein